MAVQIVMDHLGDSRYLFDPADDAAVLLAKQRFQELHDRGYWAVALAPDGKPSKLLRQFELEVEETLFIPHLQGG